MKKETDEKNGFTSRLLYCGESDVRVDGRSVSIRVNLWLETTKAWEAGSRSLPGPEKVR